MVDLTNSDIDRTVWWMDEEQFVIEKTATGMNHLLLLECYLSGQISERQWREHLKDEVFRKWLEKRDAAD